MSKKHKEYVIKLGSDLGKSLEKRASRRSVSVTALVRGILFEWLTRERKEE